MNDLRKAAEMALEALEYHVEQTRPITRTSEAITVLRAALAQPEPVCDKDPQGCWSVRCQLGKVCKNAPPPAQAADGR